MLALGEISLDHVGRVRRWPVAGEKLALEDHRSLPGGQMASAALGCARLGLGCAYVGVVGDDEAGRIALAPLSEAGIDLGHVQQRSGVASRTATVLVRGEDGERTVLAHRASELRLDIAQLPAQLIASARALLIDASEPEASVAAAEIARRHGVPVVLDADHLWPDVDALLKVTDFPVVSREFADEWGDRDPIRACLDALLDRGARMAVVTCGPEGARARGPEGYMHLPAFEVAVRDTTGCGDAFHAGFVYALLAGHPARRVIEIANAVAALATTAIGAQGGLPGEAAGAALLKKRAD